MRRVSFEPQAFEDYYSAQAWSRVSGLAGTINQTIRGIDGLSNATPYPVRQMPDGTWCAKLVGKHNLIYRLTDDEIHIISCKHHRK